MNKFQSVVSVLALTLGASAQASGPQLEITGFRLDQGLAISGDSYTLEFNKGSMSQASSKASRCFLTVTSSDGKTHEIEPGTVVKVDPAYKTSHLMELKEGSAALTCMTFFKGANGKLTGRPSTPAEIRETYRDRSVRIPMIDGGLRSINLSTCVGIAAFEVRRQLDARARA